LGKIKYGADLIWRSPKKIKFGVDLIWRLVAICANCANISTTKVVQLDYNNQK